MIEEVVFSKNVNVTVQSVKSSVFDRVLSVLSPKYPEIPNFLPQ